MTMPEMFSNIYACLVVNYFFTSLACLMLFGVCVGCHLGEPKADARRSIHKCLTEEYTRQGQRNCKIVLCSLMAHIPDKIKTIDGSKETLRLAVRITDLWFVGVADKLEQAEMVMVDSNDPIHHQLAIL
ncbi:hypothetical protein GLYMA_08G267350v4 [Glycine max]|nr:hypothetical protein GLYMA_08G267350v4 [Glycine max]KAH1053265.1 hypothetical protein GYH30_022510 [Glycine max]